MSIKISFILLSLIVISSEICVAQTGNNEVLLLDGSWEIIFDHRNEGKADSWHLNDHFSRAENIRMIQVPSCWETLEKDYEGVGFYRKEFQVPSHWKGRIIRLQFDAVNYLTEIWLNDEVVGFHEGGFTPFEFRVDEMIRSGESNILTLRVVGPIILSDKRIDGMGRLEMPSWRGGITGGIWQSVRLVSTGPAYIKDVFIQPDITYGRAMVTVEVDQTGSGNLYSILELGNFEKGKQEEATLVQLNWNLNPGINRRTFSLDMSSAGHWTPENPVLQTLELRLNSEDEISDQRSTDFGMRELSIRNKEFVLNGKPIYIKATFFEGLYPKGITLPDTEEMARREIRLAKEAGFNMIRPWRHPPPPMWLDLADEMGVMVVGSPALECMRLPLSTPYLPWRVENEIRQAILRDRNRACIVQWELFNELHRPVLKQMLRPMALTARELDPTRLILDESGGWAFGANIYLPGESVPEKFNDIHTYPGPFINKYLYDGLLAIGLSEEEKKSKDIYAKAPGRNVVPGLMSFISELGYGSLPDLEKNNVIFEKEGNPNTPAYRYHKRLASDQKKALEESGFGNLYPEMSKFYLHQQKIHGEANKRMIEAARSNPMVAGYCIHALAAGDWILGAGLLDLWRNPKTHAYEATKAANQPRIVVIRSLPRNIYAGEEITIDITGINELTVENGRLLIRITDSSGKSVFEKDFPSRLEQGITSLFNENIPSSHLRGNYSVEAEFLSDEDELICENKTEFDVFTKEELSIGEGPVAIADLTGTLTAFLGNAGIKFTKFGNNPELSLPVLVSGYSTQSSGSKALLLEIFDFVHRGGKAIFLEEMKPEHLRDGSPFPFTASPHRARGLWTCIPHLVKDHPIFAGLPSGQMMHDLYENVWAFNTLKNLEGEAISKVEPVVASVGFDWFSNEHKMHYSGPGSSWWGTDVAVLSLGKGRIIVSQLRLLNNLGKDPVADKILINMINFSYIQ